MGGGYDGYGGGYRYGFDPTPSLVFGDINAIGNGMRAEGQQNQIIAEEHSELSASRKREAQMAARIQQLEMMQIQQNRVKAPGVVLLQVVITKPSADVQWVAPAPASVII